MAKPVSTSALKTRLATLDTELLELQKGADLLVAPTAAGAAADGVSRTMREMRKSLQRATEQGHIAKL